MRGDAQLCTACDIVRKSRQAYSEAMHRLDTAKRQLEAKKAEVELLENEQKRAELTFRREHLQALSNVGPHLDVSGGER